MKKIFLKIVFITFILFQVFSFDNVFTDQVIDTEGTTVREARAKERREANKITSDKFYIDVSGFTPGGKFESTGEAKGDNPTQKRLNYFFDKTIKFLMIPFGVLAILVMTIGAGFMVVANGQDELLSKGKRIFKMGIISLVIALSSYLIIELLKTILYY